jgi:hypothetical protein
MKKINEWSIDEIDKKIIQLSIKFPGIPKKDLLRALDEKIDERELKERLNRPAFKKALSEQLMRIPELTEKAQELAIRRIIQMIQGSNDKMALEAAKVILFPLFASNRLGGPLARIEGTEKIVFQTRIGDGGEVVRDMIVEGEVDGDK